MTSTPDHSHVLTELQKHPAALLAAYEAAIDDVTAVVGSGSALRWAEEGVRLASLGTRAWEAATEYYKASPAVVQVIGFPQFERWVESGTELVDESPVVAASYFRVSPEVLPTLAPRHIANWASLGHSLSKGTWKSSSLAARFFDVSNDLVQNVTFHELQLFVTLVQTLSNRSYDLASEALVLDFPADEQDRRELPNGRQLFAASGTITNTGSRTEHVPPVLVVLRDSQERIVYSWEMEPAQTELGPGESVKVSQMVTDVPRSARIVDIGWKPEYQHIVQVHITAWMLQETANTI